MRNQDAACGEEIWRNVIEQDFLEIFLGWLGSIIGDFLKGLIRRGEDCEPRSDAITDVASRRHMPSSPVYLAAVPLRSSTTSGYSLIRAANLVVYLLSAISW